MFQTGRLSVTQVSEFVQRLVGDNLVVIEGIGFGGTCLKQTVNKTASTKRSWLKNPLAIRFEGINPTLLLKELDWLGWILFHPLVIVFSLLVAAACLMFMLGNFEAIQVRIPTINQLVSSQGIVGMVFAVGIVKMLHELGHALACRRYGAECFEIGFMLLAGIPTLYTNVSDAGFIPKKWKRIVISFAGMYVEILIGSAAAVLWFFTPPGLLNALLFNVVLLCAVNTILVNGNPLLRYDGYYILSDWLDRPNLGQFAGAEFTKLQVAAFKNTDGLELNYGLLFYAVLSFLYRWIVVGLILYAVFSIAVFWNAIEVGLLLCGLLFLVLSLSAIQKQRMEIQMVGRKFGPLSLVRTMASLGLLVLLVAMVFQVPVPRNVYCDFEVELRRSHSVYSPNDGELVRLVSAFEFVDEGTLVAQIQDDDLQHQFSKMQLEVDRQRAKLKQLEARSLESEEIAHLVEAEKKALARAEAAAEKLSEKITKLEIYSPQSGVVYPIFEESRNGARQFLDSIGESVHDDRNASRPVSRGQHLFTVADPESVLVNLYIGEDQLEPVAVGQEVRLRFDRNPKRLVTGKIQQIFDNESPVDLVDNAEPRLTKTVRISVNVDGVPKRIVPGSTGSAKISVAKQTLYQRAVSILQTAKNTRL